MVPVARTAPTLCATNTGPRADTTSNAPESERWVESKRVPGRFFLCDPEDPDDEPDTSDDDNVE